MSNTNQDYLEQYDYVDNDFFDEAILQYSTLLGSFLMNFSQLERELNQAIAEIIQDGTHETGYVIVSQLTMGKKIEIFYKLYMQLETVKEGNSKEKLEVIKKSLSTLNSFRNQLAHADWGTINESGNLRIKIKTDKETGFIKFKISRITPKNIDDSINDIEKLIDDLDEYREDVFNF